MSVAFTACDDAIDLTPKDKVTMEDYFKTPTDLELFTNPLYNNLLPDDEDVMREQSDVMVGASLTAFLRAGSDRSVPASGGGWTFTNLRRINDLLANSDKCSDKDAVAQYNAVARFFRAYFYHGMIVRFGDVPWVDEPFSSSDDRLYAPRDSREFVMSKIIEDIDYAIENLPVKEKVNKGEEPFRATKGAALALKARMCLFEGTFRKYHNISLDGNDANYYLNLAVDAAQKLMSGSYGSYKLYSTGKPNDDYLNLFAQETADAGEYILARSYREVIKDNTHGGSLYAILPTHGRPGFTRAFVASYLMKDGSRFTDIPGWQTMSFTDECKNRDPRMAQTMRTPGYTFIGETRLRGPQFNVSCTGYQPVKWVQDPKGNNGLAHASQGKSTNDMPAIRYAEVLLAYAEAKAELGTLTQSDLDNSVNLLRARVGMPNLSMSIANGSPDPYLMGTEGGYTNVEGSNKGVILEIRRERTIELAMESRRIDDLMRWRAGYCIDHQFYGPYFTGPGEYDLDGNGKPDVVLYANGAGKPNVAGADDACQYYEIGKGIFLSDGNRGYVDYHKGNNITRNGFNPARDYLYPIPRNEISLNSNLVQNPGW